MSQLILRILAAISSGRWAHWGWHHGKYYASVTIDGITKTIVPPRRVYLWRIGPARKRGRGK